MSKETIFKEYTKEELQNNIARNIQLCRWNMGLTQEELSKKLGLSYHSVAGYETQNRMPSYPVLVKLSQIFNKNLETLLGLEPMVATENTIEEDILLDVFRGCSPLIRQCILESARGISKAAKESEDSSATVYISRKKSEFTTNR